MSKGKTVAWIAAIVVGAGALNGGIVRDENGQVIPSESLSRSADLGGEQAGRALDRGAEAVGRGAGSAISESDIVKAGAIGAAAYGAAKAKAKLGDRYSVCWRRKSCDATPVPEPEVVGAEDLYAPPIQLNLG